MFMLLFSFLHFLPMDLSLTVSCTNNCLDFSFLSPMTMATFIDYPHCTHQGVYSCDDESQTCSWHQTSLWSKQTLHWQLHLLQLIFLNSFDFLFFRTTTYCQAVLWLFLFCYFVSHSLHIQFLCHQSSFSQSFLSWVPPISESLFGPSKLQDHNHFESQHVLHLPWHQENMKLLKFYLILLNPLN